MGRKAWLQLLCLTDDRWPFTRSKSRSLYGLVKPFIALDRSGTVPLHEGRWSTRGETFVDVVCFERLRLLSLQDVDVEKRNTVRDLIETYFLWPDIDFLSLLSRLHLSTTHPAFLHYCRQRHHAHSTLPTARDTLSNRRACQW